MRGCNDVVKQSSPTKTCVQVRKALFKKELRRQSSRSREGLSNFIKVVSRRRYPVCETVSLFSEKRLGKHSVAPLVSLEELQLISSLTRTKLRSKHALPANVERGRLAGQSK